MRDIFEPVVSTVEELICKQIEEVQSKGLETHVSSLQLALPHLIPCAGFAFPTSLPKEHRWPSSLEDLPDHHISINESKRHSTQYRSNLRVQN
jgi:hypothetical protein